MSSSFGAFCRPYSSPLLFISWCEAHCIERIRGLAKILKREGGSEEEEQQQPSDRKNEEGERERGCVGGWVRTSVQVEGLQLKGTLHHAHGRVHRIGYAIFSI